MRVAKMGLIIVSLIFLAGACNKSEYSGTGSVSGSDYEYEEYSEPENPYSSGSGHSAGFEWAQENEPSSCYSNSASFTEGCEEYFNQLEGY